MEVTSALCQSQSFVAAATQPDSSKSHQLTKLCGATPTYHETGDTTEAVPEGDNLTNFKGQQHTTYWSLEMSH